MWCIHRWWNGQVCMGPDDHWTISRHGQMAAFLARCRRKKRFSTWNAPIRILNNPTLDRKLQKAISGLKDPVEIRLTADVVLENRGTEGERLVLEYGRPFVGIARPKGYRRRWMVKQCFRNAGILADTGRGTYCEGFVDSASLFHVHSSRMDHARWKDRYRRDLARRCQLSVFWYTVQRSSFCTSAYFAGCGKRRVA